MLMFGNSFHPNSISTMPQAEENQSIWSTEHGDSSLTYSGDVRKGLQEIDYSIQDGLEA